MAYMRVLPKGIKVDERLVQVIGQIVQELPRDTNPDTGELYEGIFPRDVASAFYAFMELDKHELAMVRPIEYDADGKKKPQNSEYTYVDCDTERKPCGKCRRCVEIVHSDAAERAGLIDVRGFKGKVREEGRRTIQGRGYVKYFRPGEFTGGKRTKNFRDFASKVKAKLA